MEECFPRIARGRKRVARSRKGRYKIRMRALCFGLLLVACASESGVRAPATGGAGNPPDASVDAKVDAAGGGAGVGGSSGAGGAAASGGSAGLAACPEFAPGAVSGTVASPAVNEASGIVASQKNPGVLYVHNDSGDGPRIFALGLDGKHLGELTLSGATAQDWEDIALGPGPNNTDSYLYAGDIGDNLSARTNIKIFRVAEPVVDAKGAAIDQTLNNVETFTVNYADGAHNAEALLVDPKNGQVVIVTKSASGVSQVFQSAGPLPAGGGSVTLTEAISVTFGQGALSGSPLVTGGDVSPSGDQIAIRTYLGVFVWRRSTGQSLAQAFGSSPCPALAISEKQGEAVGFASDDSGYYTVSEGSAPPLHWFARK
jgi:hypothetical protein